MTEITTLIQLLRELNIELDLGRQSGFTAADARDVIRSGSVIEELRSRLEYDSCVHELTTEQVSDLNVGMIELIEAETETDNRRIGGSRRGLCLLIALTADLIEARAADPTPRPAIPPGRSRSHTGSGLRYHIAEAVRLTRRVTEGRR